MTNKTLVVALLSTSAALTACQTADFGMSSYTAQAPLQLRHIQVDAKTFYIESRGNGVAKPEMLTRYFAIRAEELCNGRVESMRYRQGPTFPNGKLPGIRMDACFTGGFCQADNATFPLVFGEVICSHHSEVKK